MNQRWVQNQPDWLEAAQQRGALHAHYTPDGKFKKFYLYTQHGVEQGEAGDWIIKGVEGELYPCKDSIFQQTYTRIK